MTISLKIDTYLLFSMFNISAKKLTDEYAGMSIEEIMAAEAKKGNTAAANFDQSVLSDPVKLIDLFELKDPGNKYAILSNLNEDDLDNLLPLLSPSDLIQGLNYFNKDKLLNIIQELPTDQLMNFVFDAFTQDQVMQMMPNEEMNKILTSTNMDKNLELKYLQTINPAIMAQMIEAVTGQVADGAQNVGLSGQPQYNVPQLIGQITNFSDDDFKEAMLSIPKANKQAFVYKLAAEDSKLYEEVDPSAFTNMLNQKKDKQDILRSANVIDEDQLVKMVSKLPKELTSIVLTQIDTTKFANVLLANFKNIISEIVAG